MSGVEEALTRAAAEANERVARCHELVACPRCSAPVGSRCAAVRGAFGGYARIETRVGDGEPTVRFVRLGELTKHPHRERWTLVQPSR